MKLKKIVLGCIGIASCICLVGCNNKQGKQDSENLIQKQEIGKGDSLVWVVDDANLAKRLQDPLNKLLKKKGVEYSVSIVGGEVSQYEERRKNYLTMLKERKTSNEDTDIIYLPWNITSNNDYATVVREGMLLPLEVEKEKVGNQTMDQYIGEFAVNSLKIDGRLYGLRGLPEYFNFGTAYNKTYLQKYNINLNTLTGDLLNNEELLEDLQKTGKNIPVPMAYWALTEEQLGYQYLYPSITVGYSNYNGDKIVNVFAQEDTKNYLEKLKTLRDKKLITFLSLDGFKSIEKVDSYFGISYYGTRDEQYSIQIKDFYDENQNQIITDTVFVPGNIDYKNLSIIPQGQITGIASWSKNPKKALEFLKLLYTDSDVANLIKFGEEGKDYTLENGRVTKLLNQEIRPRANVSYINDLITYPMGDEPENKEEVWAQYFKKNGIHPMTGFQFNPTKVQKEIDATNLIIKENAEVLDSYTNNIKKLLSGDVDNVEEALLKLNTKLEEAGISKIIEEANRQVSEWKANLKG